MYDKDLFNQVQEALIKQADEPSIPGLGVHTPPPAGFRAGTPSPLTSDPALLPFAEHERGGLNMSDWHLGGGRPGLRTLAKSEEPFQPGAAKPGSGPPEERSWLQRIIDHLGSLPTHQKVMLGLGAGALGGAGIYGASKLLRKKKKPEEEPKMASTKTAWGPMCSTKSLRNKKKRTKKSMAISKLANEVMGYPGQTARPTPPPPPPGGGLGPPSMPPSGTMPPPAPSAPSGMQIPTNMPPLGSGMINKVGGCAWFGREVARLA